MGLKREVIIIASACYMHMLCRFVYINFRVRQKLEIVIDK